MSSSAGAAATASSGGVSNMRAEIVTESADAPLNGPVERARPAAAPPAPVPAPLNCTSSMTTSRFRADDPAEIVEHLLVRALDLDAER